MLFHSKYLHVERLCEAEIYPNEPCDEEFQAKRVDKINSTESNIVIIGGYLDYYLNINGLISKVSMVIQSPKIS